jgi:hypothetical protein
MDGVCYSIGSLCDEIKLIDPNTNFIGFYFLETMYIWFHLDETLLSLSS